MVVFRAQLVPDTRPLPDISFDPRPSSVLKLIRYRVTRNIGYYLAYTISFLDIPFQVIQCRDRKTWNNHVVNSGQVFTSRVHL